MLSPKQIAKEIMLGLMLQKARIWEVQDGWLKQRFSTLATWEHRLCHLNCLPSSEPSSQIFSRLGTESGHPYLWISLTWSAIAGDPKARLIPSNIQTTLSHFQALLPPWFHGTRQVWKEELKPWPGEYDSGGSHPKNSGSAWWDSWPPVLLIPHYTDSFVEHDCLLK